VYFMAHKPLEGFDLVADWPVLLLLTGMFIAPVSSTLAIIIVRPVDQAKSEPTDTAFPKARG
jgi:hypothetical protein